MQFEAGTGRKRDLFYILMFYLYHFWLYTVKYKTIEVYASYFHKLNGVQNASKL